MGLSIGHLVIVLVIALLLFGAGRVSEIGKGLGEGIKNFKKGLKEDDEEPPARLKRPVEDDVEVEIVRVPKQLTGSKRKKIIQIEVDDDADDEEIARRVAAKKKAMAAEDEKAS